MTSTSMKTKERCPHCGSIIEERKISLFSGIVYTLKKVFQWARVNNQIEFQRKEVKFLIETDNEIARFGDWIMFGGLVYRPSGKGKGWYGLNMERIEQFFAGKYEIPMTIWKNPMTNELKKEDYVTIDKIPHLRKFLDENQEFIAQYRKPMQTSLI